MRFTAFLVLNIAILISTPSLAEVLYYEPFLTSPTPNPATGEYAVGLLDPTAAAGDGQNPIIGPTPFLTGSWELAAGVTEPNGSVQTAGLSFLGAPSLGGSQLSTPNADVRRNLSAPWTATTAGTYYISFLANYGTGNYTDGIDGNDMGYRSVEFYDATNAFLFGLSYNTYNGPFGKLPTNAPMHLDSLAGFQQLEGAPNSFAEDGITHLIVLRFDLIATDLSDSLSVYLDPLSIEEPVIPSASLFGTNITLGSIGGFTIYGGTGLGPVLDEIRVADSFIDALPEFPIPGDTNDDDEVDIEDYLVIIQHMNLTGQTAATGGVNGDGRVDLRDLRIWRDFRTDIFPGSTDDVSVPEPGSLVIIAMNWVLIITCRPWDGRRVRLDRGLSPRPSS